jgi:hypothetical protein
MIDSIGPLAGLAHQSGQLSQLARQFGGVTATTSAEIRNPPPALSVLIAQLAGVFERLMSPARLVP